MDTLIATCSMTSRVFPTEKTDFRWKGVSLAKIQRMDQRGQKEQREEEIEILQKIIFFLSLPLKTSERERKSQTLLAALFFSLVRYLIWAVLSCCVLENDFWNVKTSSLFCQGLSSFTELARRPQHERHELLMLLWLIWLWSTLEKEAGGKHTHAKTQTNQSPEVLVDLVEAVV